jgi:predicted Zn-dependent peptidase
MLGLAFSEKSLEVQRNVVMEEFKQRYLNQPYGDVWLHLKPLCYLKHPYLWNTIGKSLEHIETATMEEVKAFFYQHYLPSNATLVVAGALDEKSALDLAQKWFGPINGGTKPVLNLPWGSFYVLKVINRFKWERDYVDKVRPIKIFLLFGLGLEFSFKKLAKVGNS